MGWPTIGMPGFAGGLRHGKALFIAETVWSWARAWYLLITMAIQETPLGLEQFHDRVMTSIGPLPDSADARALRTGLARLHGMGMSVTDAVAWCRCTEEVTPNLDEDRALAMMAEIEARCSRTAV